MPYINSTITLKLSEEKKENIKTKLGKIISEIPGKSEEWLMVGFNDNHTLYFRGEKKEKAAFVQVQICGSTDRKYKNKVTESICTLLQQELSISKDNIYVTFQEIQDWGWNGTLF
ncbi:phenylpyruvate tautomerase MIF-related protein [Clostridium lundense]|uniref:phenylpyruvate tautomerase MIF-related protein n=1 Tax=Clostridium lundense TaxID=319475 RepID=UPI0004856250|nr:phenylpyruvate tautomerase MIF-related protein [Clostridium lundense]